ncbi:UNVERIFIED_CONTAM: hypothetical protein K2H54_048557 [Gekko kuhli]
MADIAVCLSKTKEPQDTKMEEWKMTLTMITTTTMINTSFLDISSKQKENSTPLLKYYKNNSQLHKTKCWEFKKEKKGGGYLSAASLQWDPGRAGPADVLATACHPGPTEVTPVVAYTGGGAGRGRACQPPLGGAHQCRLIRGRAGVAAGLKFSVAAVFL